MNPNVFLFAGEDSGDIHGEVLVSLLASQNKEDELWGVGGKRMRKAGLKALFPTESFMVMGFQDVLFNLPSLIKKFYKIRNAILTKSPKAVILIDYPEFNLLLAKSLRKNGYKGKIVQMICPTVWAWRKSRIKTLEKCFDLLLTIYPFEKELFKNSPLKVEYIGNPVAEKIANHPYLTHWNLSFELNLNQPLLSLFPGSRTKEIERNFIKQLEGAKLLLDSFPDLQLAISVARPNLLTKMKQILKKSPLSKKRRKIAFIPQELSYELMRSTTAAIAKCGTVTLELALHGCPTLVTYETSFLNRFLAKYLFRLKLPHFSIANILAEKTIFPEFIRNPENPVCYANTLRPYLTQTLERQKILIECQKVKEMLKIENGRERLLKALTPFIT